MAHHLCPVCGSSLKQIHRHAVDRLISQFYRVHRYRCSDPECKWEGLLHSRRHTAKKRKPQWWAWILMVLLGVAIGVALFEYFSTPPKISSDVVTSP